MSIHDISYWPKSKIFQPFSDFQFFTLSSKNSHKLGLTPPSDMVHHSIESWEPGEEDRTWAGGLRRLQESKKWREMEAIMFYARQCISLLLASLLQVKNCQIYLYYAMMLHFLDYQLISIVILLNWVKIQKNLFEFCIGVAFKPLAPKWQKSTFTTHCVHSMWLYQRFWHFLS